MGTRHRDLFFTPLDIAAATKLAATLEDLLIPDDTPAEMSEGTSPPLAYEGTQLRVRSADELREEDEGYLFDGDVVLGAEAEIPNEDELRARGIELDAECRERLRTVRSTLRLEHDARVANEPLFVSLQRLLLERIGPSLVEYSGTPQVLLSEVVARELVGKRGASRLETLRTSRKAKRKTRAARPGELEAVALRTRLEECIDDPFTSGALRNGLAAASPLVRSYAALLLDEGPTSDERAAKLLGTPKSEMMAVRVALGELVAKRGE